jgi:hypothetical protein
LTLPDELLAAWRRTRYTAETPTGTLTLRIGEPNPALDELLRAHGCRDWAYLTACNPGSRMLSAEDNRRRQQRLESHLAVDGFVFYRGNGIPDPEQDAHWPPEASVLVPGIAPDRAARLAREYGQLAFVHGRRGEAPLLALSNHAPGSVTE